MIEGLWLCQRDRTQNAGHGLVRNQLESRCNSLQVLFTFLFLCCLTLKLFLLTLSLFSTWRMSAQTPHVFFLQLLWVSHSTQTSLWGHLFISGGDHAHECTDRLRPLKDRMWNLCETKGGDDVCNKLKSWNHAGNHFMCNLQMISSWQEDKYFHLCKDAQKNKTSKSAALFWNLQGFLHGAVLWTLCFS